MTAKEFEDEETNILSEIPYEFREAISYHAYEKGHSCGYEEVILYLNDLVDTFKGPIEKYRIRILKG